MNTVADYLEYRSIIEPHACGKTQKTLKWVTYHGTDSERDLESERSRDSDLFSLLVAAICDNPVAFNTLVC